MKVNNKIQCKYWSKVLLSKQSKYRHRSSASWDQKISSYRNVKVTAIVVRKDVLDRHKLTCQKRSRNKICQICNKQFTRTEHPKRHLTSHSRVGYQHNFCERSFKRINFYSKIFSRLTPPFQRFPPFWKSKMSPPLIGLSGKQKNLITLTTNFYVISTLSVF